MKKNLLIAAIAITALASCSSNDFVGDESPQTSSGNVGAINFNMKTAAITRGSSQDANYLHGQFIVWGEKNEVQNAAGTAPANGNLVFQNYMVKYSENTANKTTSNTNDWEYVGITATSEEKAHISPYSETSAQTIKYWDDNADSYTFTAVSALPSDITAGRVRITKTTTGSDVYGKGYTVSLDKDNNNTYPSLPDLYFADRINIAKGNGYNHNAVQFSFRIALSQIRAGIYETIPGYRISAIKFYVKNNNEDVEAKDNQNNSAFGAVCENSTANDFEGTISVTYNNSGTDINKPIITATPSQDVKKSNLILGTNLSTISTNNLLSETASQPSWDYESANNIEVYTAVLPQTTNNPLKLKCDYTLYNPITQETIEITGKTAEIPAQYLQWKANYRYSYLFKITDNDLNPITFDAVVVTNDIGNAEYITTVTEPSITTFGVTSTGAYSIGKNEYEAGTDIYATIMSGNTVVTPVLSGNDENTKIYEATSTNETTYPITEASVAESIAHPTGNQITATDITTDGQTNFTTAPTVVPSVPAEDGITTKAINAVKLTGVKAGTYAIEYTYTVSNETKKAYKVIKVVAAQ